ncbi:MAG: thiamine-phosphate kinase [Bacteroidales bacterium]|nr:thiamine-phosphate kinase [Bacteroidales bacterium]MBS3773963.1 thiamine-phosphate kinase [Bacteroidales bacterium]
MAESENKNHRIHDLGEFGLIEHLTKNVKLNQKSSVRGIGDDAAVLNFSGKQTLVTSDLLLEGIHFNLMYTPLKHLGYKAVVINISDILAMNGTPSQILVSLGFSNRFDLNYIEELYEGIKLACEKYQVDMVGGDTSSSLTGMTINITAIGYAEAGKIVYRNTAQVNDIICTTGDLGAAYMGLQLLEREKEVFKSKPGVQPDLRGYDYILERQLKPEARSDMIRFFTEKELKPTAMIDISDGLASDLLHVCHQSDLGCKIFQDKIPIDKNTEEMAAEFDIEPLTAALNGGDDHELLFTISTDDYDKIKDEEEISPIGHMTSPDFGCYMISTSEHEIKLKAQGWRDNEE